MSAQSADQTHPEGNVDPVSTHCIFSGGDTSPGRDNKDIMLIQTVFHFHVLNVLGESIAVRRGDW